MNSSVVKFACVVGMIFLAGSDALLISYPRNELALVNESVEFQCSSDSKKSLKWTVTHAQTTELIELFAYGNFTASAESKFRVDTRIPGQCNLIIDSVDLSYAGKYKCTEQPFGRDAEAELAVIDPHALCLANASDIDHAVVENDYLWMMCSLSFSGNLKLSMSWIRNSTGSIIIYNTTNSRNQSTIVIPVYSSDNGETFTFRATFEQENNSRQTVITWNYTMKVFYSPRSLVIIPDSDVYEVGDRLECSADGNPTPSYEWTDAETNRAINGSILTIVEDMRPGQNHTFRCTAHNIVAGLRKEVLSKTVTFRVTDTTTQPDSSVALIGYVVTVMLLCIVIVIVVLVSRRVNSNGWTIKQTVLIAEPEPDILRSDPANRDNDYYVTDDGVVPQTGPAFSIYELIEGDDNETVDTPTDSLRSSQQVLVPAYTRVNKNVRRQERRSREMQMTQQQTPVYSEIAQTDLTPLTVQGCNMSDLQSSTRTANQKNYYGADGTEYTQMNNLSLQDRPAEMIPKDPMFRPVDNYAMIDHTQRAPPPPPGL